MYARFSYIAFLIVCSNGISQNPTNVIDVDDILSEDFMPGVLLVLENPANGIQTFNESFERLKTMEKPSDGSFGNAMETLSFHRSMMNQYLCRNFIAEQIVSDMTTSRIRRRMGHITPEAETTKTSKFQLAIQNNLLNDEGSAGYKDWLSKSTTLEDIYRHYDQAENRVDHFIEEDEKDEDFDEEYNGHVTGYVHPNGGHGLERPAKHREHTGLGMYYAGGGGYPYPNAVYHSGGGSGYHSGGSGYHHGGSAGYHQGGSSGYHYGGSQGDGHGGYSYHDHDSDAGNGHSAYGGVHAIHEHEHVYHSYPPKYQDQHEDSHSSKEHDLADLFDIALTALAFLSFGMFIVHVIMCISDATNGATTTAASMMMPMSMGPTSTGGMMTSTGNGGGGMTATGGGGSDTGTGGGTSDTGGGVTNTGGDSTDMGGAGGDNNGGDSTGGDSTGTAGGSTGGSTGDGDTQTGGGTAGGTTGGGSTGDGGSTGGGNTGGTSPGTATGTGEGNTGTGGGTTGTGGGAPTGGTGTGNDNGDGGTGTGKDTFKFRFKRDIPTITNPNNQVLNELARKVLVSIEAALIANNDNGVCLRKSLCENNKYSRTLEGRNKIIIPMWSLGMSWLSGRLVKGVSPATSMLDTLKASILGLGKANCEIIYQDCDFRRELIERRRKRRKRNTS